MPLQEREAFPAHNAFGVHENDVGNALHFQGFLHGAFCVDGAVVLDFGVAHGFHLVGCLVGDADDHHVFLELLADFVQFGDGFPAGSAPCCPEIDEDKFAFEFRLFGNPLFHRNLRGFLVQHGFCPQLFAVVALLCENGVAAHEAGC